MTSTLFISISALEAFALLTSTLNIFRFKVGWYLKDIIVMSVVLALSSYMMRIVLEVPWFDIPLTMCAIIVFMKFTIRVKPQYAVILTLSGYAFYTAFQAVIFLLLKFTIDFDSSMLMETNGLYIYLLQIATAGMTMLVAYLLKVIGYGFTFIIHPPHSDNKFSKKENTVFYAAIVTFLILTAAAVFLLSGYLWLGSIIVLLNFSLLYYLLHRRSEQE